MNRTSSGLLNSIMRTNLPKKHNPGLLLSKAIPGFIQFKGAEGLSLRTLVRNEHDLYLYLEIQGDWDIWEVITQELREYLNHMHTKYTPCRITGNHDRMHPVRTCAIYGSALQFSLHVHERNLIALIQ